MICKHAMVVCRQYILPVASLGAFALGAQATPEIAGPIDADVERVVDGDTVRVSAKIWVDQRVSVAVRLKGVDAPELFRPQCEAERDAARKAKSFVEEIVGGGVSLLEIEHDKYGGRVVARLETDSGTDVGAALVSKGLATIVGAPDPWRR